jgi:hypothetical protein
MAKRFFIKSSGDMISRELEKLQNKVSFLEASTSDKGAVRKPRKTAVYSPPVEAEAKRIELEFEDDDEMFTAPRKAHEV